ncbi:Antiviral helicase ski2 [Metarhizium acridum]|nr:Antiviral helicase ski2 [Metarhizium acridum]
MAGIDALLLAQDEDGLSTSLSGNSQRLDSEALKRHLEDKFLTPSREFSSEWLNLLQQRWEFETEYTSLFKLAPTQTRTVTRFQRHGLEGRVTGYKNVTLPSNSATAKNSTSLLRKPANRADFVRGAAGFFPFAPGGLDGIEATAALEDQVHTGGVEECSRANKLDRVIQLGEGGLLQIAPGLDTGIDFSMKKNAADEEAANAVQEALEEEPENAGSVEETEGEIPDDTPADASDTGKMKTISMISSLSNSRLWNPMVCWQHQVPVRLAVNGHTW